MELLRHGTTWAVGSRGCYCATSPPVPSWATEEPALTAALGGSVDETAAVDSWLLAWRGSREVGVVPSEFGFTHTGPVPVEGKVYTGEELARWFQSYGGL